MFMKSEFHNEIGTFEWSYKNNFMFPHIVGHVDINSIFLNLLEILTRFWW